MKSIVRFLAVIVTITAICRLSAADNAAVLNLEVAAPKENCLDVPVCAVIDLPDFLANTPVENIGVTVGKIWSGTWEVYELPCPGQLVAVSPRKAELWWTARRLTAGEISRWQADLYVIDKARWQTFAWQDKKGEYLDLLFDGRKVTRYMYSYDTSNEQRRFETYKPFHHVFDTEGNLLTNGPDGVQPYLKDKILYPHHRGVFIGWSRLEFAGSRYDFWGMGGGAVQVHQRFLELTAGPVLARSKVLIHWNDKDGKPIIAEQRQTTVFRQSDPTILLLEFRSELKAVRGDVFLNGDPEHAGFQYRAHNDVDSGGKEVKATYLFHEDGIDPRKDKDLPWVAMSCGLHDRRYSVQYMNHPDNPRPSIYSAYRDYGRFGAFFTRTINSGESLQLCYRIWVAQSKMPDRQSCASKYSAFVDPPKTNVTPP
jgi:hypothetical protein